MRARDEGSFIARICFFFFFLLQKPRLTLSVGARIRILYTRAEHKSIPGDFSIVKVNSERIEKKKKKKKRCPLWRSSAPPPTVRVLYTTQTSREKNAKNFSGTCPSESPENSVFPAVVCNEFYTPTGFRRTRRCTPRPTIITATCPCNNFPLP